MVQKVKTKKLAIAEKEPIVRHCLE